MRLDATTVPPEAGRQSCGETLQLSQFIQVTLSAVRRTSKSAAAAKTEAAPGASQAQESAYNAALLQAGRCSTL